MVAENNAWAFHATDIALTCGAAGLAAAASHLLTKAWIRRKRAPARANPNELARLAARVGHEIGNPLTYVLQNLEQVRDLVSAGQGRLPAAGIHAVRDAIFGVKRATDNVRRLRERAAPQTARAPGLDATDPLLRGPLVVGGPLAELGAERGRGRILVVDDDDMVGYAVRRGLEHAYVVDVVQSGEAALERLERHAYDLILSDLRMPGIDGMELFSRACERDPSLASRFVFMTGSAADPRAQAFFAAVPNRYLQKPCGLQDLRDAVEAGLREHGGVSGHPRDVSESPRPRQLTAVGE